MHPFMMFFLGTHYHGHGTLVSGFPDLTTYLEDSNRTENTSSSLGSTMTCSGHYCHRVLDRVSGGCYLCVSSLSAETRPDFEVGPERTGP